MRLLTLTVALLFAVACGEKQESHDDHDGHDHGGHAEEAKHGGEMIEVGSHEGHIEVKLDHEKGTIALWLYDADMKDWKADAAPVINFTLDGKPHSVKAEGSGAEWLFSDKSLKGEPGNIRFRLAMGGKTYQAKWDHAHHDHDRGHGDHDEGHDKHDGHDHDEGHEKGHDNHGDHDHDEGHEKGHDDHAGHDHDHGDG